MFLTHGFDTVIRIKMPYLFFSCFRVTKDRKIKENIALELSFVNSNLQLLKEELAQLNSSVDIYQNKR